MGKLFSRQTIGVVRIAALVERDDKSRYVMHGGWVLRETVFLGYCMRRASLFGDYLAQFSHEGKIRSAAVDCWLKGGPVPTQYLDAPTRDKPKLRVIGGTDGMRR